jgi:hypothetical protein
VGLGRGSIRRLLPPSAAQQQLGGRQYDGVQQDGDKERNGFRTFEVDRDEPPGMDEGGRLQQSQQADQSHEHGDERA